MIDTHCHLDSELYQDIREEVISESFESGIKAIIIPATDIYSFKKAEAIADTDDRLYFAAGIHPHNANEYNDVTVAELNRIVSNPKCKAIGEIGLDYYYDFHPRELQIEVFEKLMDKAKESKLPAIIHNREADDDIYNVLNKYCKDNNDMKSVLHCYSSDLEYTRKIIDFNLMFSFTGNITFKKSNLSEVVEYIPLDRIMLETDGPYMTPVPYRGKVNRPKYIKLIADKIAEIKKTTTEEVIEMTSNNAKKFFKILTIFLVMIMANANLGFAEDTEDHYIDDEVRFERPLIGIGPIFATNTVVEAYSKNNGTEEVSYDGILSPGARLTITPLQWLLVDVSYLYTKNQKIADENVGVRPTQHHIYGLGTTFILNPYSRINFGLNLGANYINTVSGLMKDPPKSRADFAVNVGLGLTGNIEMWQAGLLNISIKLDFYFITNKYQGYLRTDFDNLRDVSTFYSIPKLELTFYPSFLKL